MSERSSETSERTPLGDSLVRLGENLKTFSAKEIKNEDVAAALLVLGATEVVVLTSSWAGYDRLASTTKELSQIGDRLNAAATAGEAIKSLDFTTKVAGVLAAHLAAVGAVEGKKLHEEGNAENPLPIFWEGTTPVSTHILPALGELFTQIGNSSHLKR